MVKISISLAFFFVIYFSENVFANKHSRPKPKNDVIILTSIPKSGSHLAEKCISLLTRKKSVVSLHVKTNSQKFLTGKDISDIQNKIKKASNNSFASGHITYSSELDLLATQNKYKIIFIYRDPRAQVASLARWWMPINNIDNDLSKTILSLITDKRLYQFKWDNIQGVNDLYIAYLPWIDSPNTLTIKFEELVGEKGGGSSQVQYATVSKIANFLGLKVNETIIKNICLKLFGGTVTFDKGQINGWKDCFNEEHKQAFKKYAGNLLPALGYETGLEW
jgi:5S rRNA maturation endonuclease (ribonuclease M5)